MSGRSLVRQALLGIILAELACVAALTAITVAHERAVRFRAIDVTLEGRADSLFGAVQDAEDLGDNIMLDPREMVLPQGDLFAVYDGGGRRLGSSPQAPLQLIEPGCPGVHSRSLDGRSYRVLERHNLRIIDRAESGGAGLQRPLTIVYATPLDRIWRQIFKGIGFYLGASLLLIAGTTLFMVLLMRRLLQPLEQLAAATAAVTPRDLEFRAPRSALELRELEPLAHTLSAVLSELKVAFERQHRFLGDAAHELKTAVAVVRSSLQLLLLRPRTPAEYAGGLHQLVEDNLRVERLIARMLLLARLEEQSDPSPAASDLAAVASACLQKLQPLAEQAGVHLEGTLFGVTLAPGEATCSDKNGRRYMSTLSSHDLDVLLSNLLTNAVEHSPPGSSVHLELTAEGTTAKVHVLDRGEGIPESALPHLFERFFRADSSRARTTGGAGLGLSISKAIVDSARGTMSIHSRLGEGTAVTATLPLCTQSEPDPTSSGVLNVFGAR